jgi:hypothetical protein
MHPQTSPPHPTGTLSARELAMVLAETKRNATRSANSRRNLIDHRPVHYLLRDFFLFF